MSYIVDGNDERLSHLRERLSKAQPKRRQVRSIAADVEALEAEIADQRARGVGWREITLALTTDERHRGAVISAFYRAQKGKQKEPGSEKASRVGPAKKKKKTSIQKAQDFSQYAPVPVLDEVKPSEEQSATDWLGNMADPGAAARQMPQLSH